MYESRRTNECDLYRYKSYVWNVQKTVIGFTLLNEKNGWIGIEHLASFL